MLGGVAPSTWRGGCKFQGSNALVKLRYEWVLLVCAYVFGISVRVVSGKICDIVVSTVAEALVTIAAQRSGCMGQPVDCNNKWKQHETMKVCIWIELLELWYVTIGE